LFASGAGWQGGTDESWAIDNLKLTLKTATGLVQAFFTNFDEGAPSALSGVTTTEAVQGFGPTVTRMDSQVNFLGALVSPPDTSPFPALPTFTNVFAVRWTGQLFVDQAARLIAENPGPVNGQLTASVSFTLDVLRAAGTALSVPVTLTADATTDNTTLIGLAADLGSAIDAALVESGFSPGAVGVGVEGGTRLRLVANNTTITRLTIQGAGSLGFATGQQSVREGPVSFFIASDDGARLYIDGNLVVDNDGVHRSPWPSRRSR